MNTFESIVVTGGSGTGKTTLVNGLRQPDYESRVVIPHRFMTRPVRLDDNPDYTTRISLDAFNTKLANGLLAPHWSRVFGQGHIEHYGFEPVTDDERMPVYAVTNPFLHPSFKDILQTSLIVSLQAFPTTRTDRIFERVEEPEKLPLSELSARLLDSEALKSHQPHVILDTTELSPEDGQATLRSIVDDVLSKKG